MSSVGAALAAIGVWAEDCFSAPKSLPPAPMPLTGRPVAAIIGVG